MQCTQETITHLDFLFGGKLLSGRSTLIILGHFFVNNMHLIKTLLHTSLFFDVLLGRQVPLQVGVGFSLLYNLGLEMNIVRCDLIYNLDELDPQMHVVSRADHGWSLNRKK